MILNIMLMLKFLFLAAPANKEFPKSIYDFKVAAIAGDSINLSNYRGKKILIVNTTSKDGYNIQYSELEALYEKYKDKLVVIGFPIDDYGEAPVSKKDAEVFVQKNYNVSFPMAAKTIVKGDNMTPVYKWLTDKKYNKLKDSEVKWNFQKYLINEKGELIAVFDPKVRVTSPEVITAIEQ